MGDEVSDFRKNNFGMATDNPILEPEGDLLGRVDVANSFAEQILRIDASEGVVVGVLGPWGSGKTSFVNLVCSYLRRRHIQILHFNPWMFSGSEQLVKSFFVELAAQMKLRPGLAEAGNSLAEYGEFFTDLGWVPVVGPWIERARLVVKILGRISRRGKQGIAAQRHKVESALSSLDEPIVVVLDDIDRLTTSEIRDTFKLVRLTANFPNIIYLVAFDRIRVEEALQEQGIPGRSYLEKIVQIAIDLPEVPEHLLHDHVLKAIEMTVTNIEKHGPFDSNLWPDVFMEIVRPLVRNIRDVRRYVMAVDWTLRGIGDHVALVDVLGLETARIFLPDVYRMIPPSLAGLTTISNAVSQDKVRAQQLESQVERLIKCGGDHAEVVRALVERLFPGAMWHIGQVHYTDESKGQWLKSRRVAHEHILRYYLERVHGEGLNSFVDAEQAWMSMHDRDKFDAYLRGVKKSRIKDVLSSLEIYEDEYSDVHVIPGSVVLLNLLPDLPEEPLGMFEFDNELYVCRVVLRLLRSLKDPKLIEDATRNIYTEVGALSSKLALITIVGHQEHAGHKLISESGARALEKEWREEVISANIETIVNDPSLFRVLIRARLMGIADGNQVEIDPSPRMTLAVLRSARTEVRSGTPDSRSIRRYPRFDWDALVKLYGDEVTLRERVDDLRTSCPKDAGELLELADKYLSGWRPDGYSRH